MMSNAAHRLLDKLVEDLKTELFASMHECIVVELEKREKALQNMVEEMLLFGSYLSFSVAHGPLLWMF